MTKNSQQNDVALVEKAKKDPDAFRELYDAYFPKIFRYVSWRVGNRADAEDIVSDIFTKALHKLDLFETRTGATFSSWLFRIAHNTVADYYRAGNKRDHEAIDDIGEIEDDELLPGDDLARRQLFAQLYKMVQELPDRQGEIIALRFFSGMKNKEIASVLNIGEKSVASSLCRGLKKLHDNLRSSSSARASFK